MSHSQQDRTLPTSDQLKVLLTSMTESEKTTDRNPHSYWPSRTSAVIHDGLGVVESSEECLWVLATIQSTPTNAPSTHSRILLACWSLREKYKRPDVPRRHDKTHLYSISNDAEIWHGNRPEKILTRTQAQLYRMTSYTPTWGNYRENPIIIFG